MEDFYSVPDPYGTYQVKDGEKPYEILMKMKAWNNEIRSTISKVNNALGKVHEQQTQILQNIDSIELSVLDIIQEASGQQTQISQLLLEVGQVMINVTEIDTRVGTAEGSLIVQAGLIASKVSTIDLTGNKVSSLIAQDPLAVSIIAGAINLSGYVTFNSLKTEGATIINGSNITTGQILANLVYGQVFVVGNGTSTQMVLTSLAGSHRIYSYDAAGFRIESAANLSLQGNAGTVYSNSKFWARASLQVTGFSQLQDMSASRIDATQIVLNGAGVVNVDSVQSMIFNATSGLTTKSYVDSGLRQKEIDIVAWANRTFVAK